jgi:hypothetical protein
VILRPGIAQLAWLHASAPWRAMGIGSRLSEQLEQIARTAGDSDMVMASWRRHWKTPCGSTSVAAQPMADPLAELFELEPEDMHMRKML